MVTRCLTDRRCLCSFRPPSPPFPRPPAVAVAVGVLLAFHCYLLSTGQTTIEFYENWAARRQGLISAFPFDAGLRANVAAAFGPPIHRRLPWWSVFLLVDFRRPPVPSYMLCQPDPKARDDAYCMQLD